MLIKVLSGFCVVLGLVTLVAILGSVIFNEHINIGRAQLLAQAAIALGVFALYLKKP